MEQEFIVFENKWFYQHPIHKDYYANEDGLVLSNKWNKYRIIKPSANIKTGYYQFNINEKGERKNYRVNRFVYECFNGLIQEGYQIDHINHNISDNSIDNLSLVTRSLNMRNKDKMNGRTLEYIKELPDEAIQIKEVNSHIHNLLYFVPSTKKFYRYVYADVGYRYLIPDNRGDIYSFDTDGVQRKMSYKRMLKTINL